MPKVKVYVSMFTYPIEVNEDEVAVLRSQGLLTGPPPAPVRRTPATPAAKTPARTTAAAAASTSGGDGTDG